MDGPSRGWTDVSHPQCPLEMRNRSPRARGLVGAESGLHALSCLQAILKRHRWGLCLMEDPRVVRSLHDSERRTSRPTVKPAKDLDSRFSREEAGEPHPAKYPGQADSQGREQIRGFLGPRPEEGASVCHSDHILTVAAVVVTGLRERTEHPQDCALSGDESYRT